MEELEREQNKRDGGGEYERSGICFVVRVFESPNTERVCFVGFAGFRARIRRAFEEVRREDEGLTREFTRANMLGRNYRKGDHSISPTRVVQDIHSAVDRMNTLVIREETIEATVNEPSSGKGFYFNEKGNLQGNNQFVAMRGGENLVPQLQDFSVGITLAFERGGNVLYFNAPENILPFDLALACILAAEIGLNGKPRYSPSEYLRAASIFMEREVLRMCFTGGFLRRRRFILGTFRENQERILQEAGIAVAGIHMSAYV